MDKLLTKEQNEELINALRGDTGPEDDLTHNMRMKYVKSIIDKFTEPSFPSINITTPNGGKFTVVYTKEGYIDIKLDTMMIGASIELTPKEFKSFAAGCDKIVEWINEQI